MTIPRICTRVVAAALLPAALLLASCGGGGGGQTKGGADLVASDKLTVCSDVPYPPLEDFDKKSSLGFTGFDIETAQAIAKGLGVDLTVQDVGFETLQSGQVLASGQCDMGASAMTITPEREKHITFSAPYLKSNQSLLVYKDSGIKSISDLAGKRVGVQQGTTGQRYAQAHVPKGTSVVAFPSDGEMYQALKAHQVDALLQDFPVNYSHTTTTSELAIVEQYKTDETYGFAFDKPNTKLADEVDAQLKKLMQNGTYAGLLKKYGLQSASM